MKTTFAVSANVSINSWDTSQVTDMVQMFLDTKGFDQSLKDWDVTHIKDDPARYLYMFKDSSLSRNNWNDMVNNNSGWASMDKSQLGITY